MITPFKVFEEEVFPEVHSYVVHKLADEGVRQQEIAEKLGITQAMVSKYQIKSEIKGELFEKIGEKAIGMIRNNAPNEDISYGITCLCLEIMQNGELCKVCSEKNGLKNCNACMNLGVSENKGKVIDNLKRAIRILEEKNPIELMPNVMMNIAMRTEDAKGKEDVASIPGRIVKINNKVKASNAPQFNSSTHLANKLLENKKFGAIMNIRCDNDVEKAIKKEGVREVLIDRGGFGIEPCAYVLGKDAVDVVNKVMKIKGGLI